MLWDSTWYHLTNKSEMWTKIDGKNGVSRQNVRTLMKIERPFRFPNPIDGYEIWNWLEVVSNCLLFWCCYGWKILTERFARLSYILSVLFINIININLSIFFLCLSLQSGSKFFDSVPLDINIWLHKIMEDSVS